MRALILGGASCVHEDMAQAQSLFTPDLIIAVNDIGVALPRLDHWVTYHPFKFGEWMQRRSELGLPPAGEIWSHKAVKGQGRPMREVPDHWGGSSGLLAVQVAIQELKVPRSVIAGMPMTETPHFKRKPGVPWGEATAYRVKWEQRLAILLLHVRSMSGWTQELLGGPTREWLGLEMRRVA